MNHLMIMAEDNVFAYDVDYSCINHFIRMYECSVMSAQYLDIA